MKKSTQLEGSEDDKAKYEKRVVLFRSKPQLSNHWQRITEAVESIIELAWALERTTQNNDTMFSPNCKRNVERTIREQLESMAR